MIIEFNKKNFARKPPFLLRHKKFLSLLLLGFIPVSLLFVDRPLACLFCATKPLQELANPINRIFSSQLTLLLFPSFFFFHKFVAKQEVRSRKCLLLSSAIALSLLTTDALQILIGKSTPLWLCLHGEITFRPLQWNPSFHSTPSAISCNIGVLGSSLACLYPKRSLLFLLGGFVLALAPVFASICFLSDALLGLYLGGLLSFLIFKKMKKEMSFT